MNGGRSGIGKLSPIGHELRGVPYRITVGVPVTVHPGMVTALNPDSDGSPTSAPGFTRRLGLMTSPVVATATVRARSSRWVDSRRATAVTDHPSGD